MARVRMRFDPRLDAFLAPQRRGVEFDYDGAQHASVKHAIEALGVPHTEVGRVQVDDIVVGLGHRLRDGERVQVAAVGAAASDPERAPRFVADAHLGRLARYLRFLGFDTLQRNAWDDGELVALARAGQRIVLTRDRALLMRRDVERGCCLRAIEPLAQLREVGARYALEATPATWRAPRCLLCNTPVVAVQPASVASSVPPQVRAHHDAFWRCPSCARVYWRGSHWQRMRARADAALREARAAASPGGDG